jgi:glycosyltransferase involved in cell wall biosynthesis
MQKNVLSIIYFFPPLSGSGVQRPLKFIKYMPELGFYPIIETVKNGHNFAYDHSLMNEVPDSVKVYRSNSGETLWLRNLIEKVIEFKNKLKDKDKENQQISAKLDQGQSIKDKVFNFIDRNFFIPDSKIRWYPHAIKDIDSILKNEKVDFIYSSSYPYTVHLVGLYAKKKSKLPWIADFRDPWVGNVFMTKDHSITRKKKEEKLESQVITHADKVIMVTEPICEMYRKRYPEFKDKFVTITNGFDEDDFQDIDTKINENFTICYSGILSEGQSVETLIKAIELFFKDNEETRKKLKLKFIGYMIDDYKQEIMNSTIKNNVEFLPYMPHKQCAMHMKSANINLLVLADKEESKGVFSGKIFDYIAAQRPILGIMPEGGVAANLIIDKEIGDSFNHGEYENVYKFINENYQMWLNGEESNTNAIEKCSEFNRKNLTKNLTAIFQEIESKSNMSNME